jgi:cell division transport system permease protein
MRFNLGFFIKEAFKNMRLNLLMSMTAVTTTFICILVLGIGILVSSHVEGLIGSVRGDVAINAFFPRDMKEKEMDSIRRDVEGWPGVSGVNFISREEALAEFKDDFKERPEIFSDFESGVLPASLEIKLDDPADAEGVAKRLRAEGFAAGDLRYPQQTIERLNEVTGYMLWGLRAATALFLVSSVLLISNAIRISIFARRKEIEVMKLVGASDGFVRTPFVFEGLLQGLVGAALATGVVIWANVLFVQWSQEQLPFVPISGDAVNTAVILALLLGVGVVIGVLGSFLSVTRFLRV